MRAHSAILCIDDEELQLSIRKMVLESAGYAVFTAANSVQGLKTFNAHQIDLVITDHSGSIRGIALVEELRKLNPRLPILILSGGKIPHHPLKPPDYFLHKLEGPTKLIAKVQSAIRWLGRKHAGYRLQSSERKRGRQRKKNWNDAPADGLKRQGTRASI